MESPTANVLEVSRERIANQNQSLPTLLEVRQTSSQDCFHLESSSGITGAVIFVILLVLLIWMICVRATRVKKPEKHGLGKKGNFNIFGLKYPYRYPYVNNKDHRFG